MTDTETRLRDYLQTQANSVDEAEAREPDLDRRQRRTWPVLAAAAAITAVLILTLPLALHLAGKDDRKPAHRAPAGLTIPYTLRTGDRGTLHDRGQTVALPEQLTSISGRVAGGWAVTLLTPRGNGEAGKNSQVAVLTPDGTVRWIGPYDSDYLQLSPDRTQLATAEPLGHDKTRVAVFDIASGRELSSVVLAHRSTILWGWNKDGIWLAEDYKVGVQPSVWQPSTGRLTQIAIPGFDLGLVAPGSTDRVLVTTRSAPDQWCLQAGRLVAGKFTVDRKFCGTGGRTIYPVLSPDGATILHTELKTAIDVATGRQTKLDLDGGVLGFPKPVFESSTQVIISVPAATKPPVPRPTGGTTRPLLTAGAVVHRCDVTSGVCETALKTPDDTSIGLIQP